MDRWTFEMKNLIKVKGYWIDLFLSFSALAVLILYYFRVLLRDYLASLPNNPVPDQLLNRLGPYNLDYFASNYVYIIFAVFFLFVIFKYPEKLPFYIKVFFFLYLSKFLILTTTNLTYPADAIHESMDTIYNDLFFSGHTAFAFMTYLITRNKTKYLKYFFLLSTLIEAFTVLAMHIHYTIDVYAAPFFAYGIYKMTLNLFAKNYKAYDKYVKIENVSLNLN